MNKKELWKKYWNEERNKQPKRIFDPENLFNFFSDNKKKTMDMMWWAYSQSVQKESKEKSK